MSNYRRTTAKNLQQVINEGLVSVVDVQAEDKETGEVSSFIAEQLRKDLDNYVSAGVFSESIDFRYEIKDGEHLQVRVGFMSLYCNNCITATLCLSDGVTMEQIKNCLSKMTFS